MEEQSEITTQVENLYAAAWGNRTKACDLLTGKHRTSDFTAEALLARGYKELAKPDANRDFAGLYNTVVTLTDMSRAVTQKEGMKERIKAFATKVQEEIP